MPNIMVVILLEVKQRKWNGYPLGSEARKMKVNGLKSSLRGQQRGLKNFCTSSRATTIASFIASFFSEKRKAFSEGIAKRMLSINFR